MKTKITGCDTNQKEEHDDKFQDKLLLVSRIPSSSS